MERLIKYFYILLICLYESLHRGKEWFEYARILHLPHIFHIVCTYNAVPSQHGKFSPKFAQKTPYISLVRPSVNLTLKFRMITRHRFELESPNLQQTCTLWYSWLILKMEVIDLHLQCHFGYLSRNSKKFGVSAIGRHRFGLESPNLQQTCVLGYSRLVLKMEVIDLVLQCHFGHFDLEYKNSLSTWWLVLDLG